MKCMLNRACLVFRFEAKSLGAEDIRGLPAGRKASRAIGFDRNERRNGTHRLRTEEKRMKGIQKWQLACETD